MQASPQVQTRVQPQVQTRVQPQVFPQVWTCVPKLPPVLLHPHSPPLPLQEVLQEELQTVWLVSLGILQH